MNSNTLSDNDASFPADRLCLMDVAARPPVAMVAGNGAWLIDERGKRYLDFVQGWAVNCLGHSPALMTQVLAQQAATLLNCSPAFYNAPMLELALRQSLAMSDGRYGIFFERPIAATLLGVALAMTALSFRSFVRRGLDWRARMALAGKGES